MSDIKKATSEDEERAVTRAKLIDKLKAAKEKVKTKEAKTSAKQTKDSKKDSPSGKNGITNPPIGDI